MVNDNLEKTSVYDSLNQSLLQLVEEARNHPIQSIQRQLALNKLIDKILKSGKLGHPQKGLWSSNFYEDIYNEALQKTLLKICQKIDNYRPEHSVMAWVNFSLKNQFIDALNDRKKKGITNMPKSAKKQLKNCVPSLEDIEQYFPAEDVLTEAELLRQFIENDPENILKTEQIQEHPEITFQLLAQAKFIEDKTWLEIANNLGVPVQTLYSFFYRQLQKSMPYFRKYLQE